jgi:hypothetical protein
VSLQERFILALVRVLSLSELSNLLIGQTKDLKEA